MVIDVEGNQAVWNLDSEISRVVETGAVLGLNLGGNQEVPNQVAEVVADADGNCGVEYGGRNHQGC